MRSRPRSSCAAWCAPPNALPSISPRLTMPICAPGMPGISKVGMPPPVSCTWISISRSSSSPLAQHLAELGAGVGPRRSARPARRARAPRRRSRPWPSTSLRSRSRVMRERDLHQVAHDLLDVAADIADLGELGRLDLDERAPGPAWPGAARSRSCRRRSGRSSGCSWAAPPRAAPRAAAGGASGCAARWRRRAWRRSGRRCGGRARRRSRAG